MVLFSEPAHHIDWLMSSGFSLQPKKLQTIFLRIKSEIHWQFLQPCRWSREKTHRMSQELW